MRKAALGFLLGILGLHSLPQLPPLWAFWLAWPLGVLLLWWSSTRWLAATIAGFLWAWWLAAQLLAQQVPTSWEGRDLTVEGVIADIPEPRDHSVRFLFDVFQVQHGPAFKSPLGRVRLSWYGEVPPLKAGQAWRFTIRLKRPHGFLNPGGFDYEAWLYGRRIGATGYVRDSGLRQRLTERVPGYWLAAWRHSIVQTVREQLPNAPMRGVILALAVGYRAEMGHGLWETLTATGTNHLVAISGLHVGLVAAWVFFITRWLWVLWPRAPLWKPAMQPAALAALVAAGAYAALAGFALPTVRALVMASVVLGGMLAGRTVQPSRSLALAVWAVLIIDPMAVLQAGFWLSFLAVAVILYAMSGRLAVRSLWWRWGRVQWVVSLGLVPALLLWFDYAPLVAPLANLVAVPVVSLLVVPLVLLALLFLFWWEGASRALLQLAQEGLRWLHEWLAALQAVPHAQWHLPDAPLWMLVLGLLGVALLLVPRGWPGRWVGALLWLPLVTYRAPTPTPGELWFTVLDVGQGLATVVQTAKHVLVYDTGPRFSASFNAGEAVVVPFLKQQGIEKIDLLMVSNGDSDHSGGVAVLERTFPIGRILTGARPGELEGIPAQPCHAEQKWSWDGAEFSVLHPVLGQSYRGNNRSCVLQIEHPGGRILLTGDIEARVERELVGRYGDGLASEILVVPHHGSATSSSKAFVEQVEPSLAIFSVGYRNRFGFPRPEVWARYRRIGARILTTAAAGAISLRFLPSGNRSGPHRYRDSVQRYWRQ